MKLLFVLYLLPLAVFAQFSSEDEASFVLAGGNTELETFVVRSKNSYVEEKNTFQINGHYTYGESSNVRSAERWDVLFRYERELSKKFSAFLFELVEANRFAGFRRRYNTDIGIQRELYKSKKNTTIAEIGYRYTVEEKSNDSLPYQHDSKARIYVETQHNFNENISGKFWTEYIPNFTESEDYLVNLEPSLFVSLSNLFSFKFSFLWNYDNLPAAGSGKHDYTYTTGLIAKF